MIIPNKEKSPTKFLVRGTARKRIVFLLLCRFFRGQLVLLLLFFLLFFLHFLLLSLVLFLLTAFISHCVSPFFVKYLTQNGQTATRCLI